MKPVRQTNIEVLRILSTFSILVVHANFLAFGAPDRSDCMSSPGWSFLRFAIQAFAETGVDAFVLISGWFGIRPSAKKLFGLAFQCFFFAAGIHLAALLAGSGVSAKKMVLDVLLLSRWNWFLKAYVGLVVLAPVLNAYCDNRDEKSFRFFLCSFFALQTAWGWLARDTQSFRDGKSIVSFLGLYLLARYVRLHKPAWTRGSSFRDFSLAGLLSLATATIGFAAARIGWKGGVGTMFSDASPLVVASAALLLLGFSKIPFASEPVNRIARSCFASYLVHTHPCILRPVFVPALQRMMAAGIGGVGTVALFLLAIFGGSVVLDRIRIAFWALLAGGKPSAAGDPVR